MSSIGKIHEAAENAVSPLLDEMVYLDRELHLFEFADTNHRSEEFLDIPVKNIVALGRDDFWERGDSWRAVTKKLHGQGWTKRVFDYFEGEIEDKYFPASGSLGELKIVCIGGACECGNGNHRLVAAKSWIISKFGDKAVLRSVKTIHYPINSTLRSLLALANDEGSNILVSRVEYHERRNNTVNGEEITAFIQLSSEPDVVYAWVNQRLSKIAVEKSLIQKLLGLKRASWFDKRKKEIIPSSVIKALLDDSWVEKLSNKSMRATSA